MSPTPQPNPHLLTPEALEHHIAALKPLFAANSSAAGPAVERHLGPFLQHHLANYVTARALEKMCTRLFGATLSRNAIIGRIHRMHLVVYNDKGAGEPKSAEARTPTGTRRKPRLTVAATPRAPARRRAVPQLVPAPKSKTVSPEVRRRYEDNFFRSQKKVLGYYPDASRPS